ncbi:MAG: plastocyanin [Burkholderiaceae bacterium]
MNTRPSPSRLAVGLAVILATTLGTTLSIGHAATLTVTVLARNGEPLADAVVIVEPAQAGQPAAPSPKKVEIRQEKLQFVPQVSVLPVGSQVVFSNLDRYDHHVRALPADGTALSAAPDRGFAIALPARVGEEPPSTAIETLNEPGPWQLGCHLHGSMRGSIYVTDSPWVVKTDATGQATVTQLPEGPAQVRLWYPRQLVEQPATPTTIGPTTQLRLPTTIRPPRRRS